MYPVTNHGGLYIFALRIVYRKLLDALHGSLTKRVNSPSLRVKLAALFWKVLDYGEEHISVTFSFPTYPNKNGTQSQAAFPMKPTKRAVFFPCVCFRRGL